MTLELVTDPRIIITGPTVQVIYYTPEELYKNLPWYKKLFVETCDLCNRKNMELYLQARYVVDEKHLIPIFPPLRYIRG